MASDSIFESFPSYPQCFMRGEYALVFRYLLWLGFADNEMAACRNSGRVAPVDSLSVWWKEFKLRRMITRLLDYLFIRWQLFRNVLINT